jgi:hypothetical protein
MGVLMRKVLQWSIGGILAIACLAYAAASTLMYLGIAHFPWGLAQGWQMVLFVLLLIGGVVALAGQAPRGSL